MPESLFKLIEHRPEDLHDPARLQKLNLGHFDVHAMLRGSLNVFYSRHMEQHGVSVPLGDVTLLDSMLIPVRSASNGVSEDSVVLKRLRMQDRLGLYEMVVPRGSVWSQSNLAELEGGTYGITERVGVRLSDKTFEYLKAKDMSRLAIFIMKASVLRGFDGHVHPIKPRKIEPQYRMVQTVTTKGNIL